MLLIERAIPEKSMSKYRGLALGGILWVLKLHEQCYMVQEAG